MKAQHRGDDNDVVQYVRWYATLFDNKGHCVCVYPAQLHQNNKT